MIINKVAITKWSSNNKKWYESKGHIFTKYKDEFEVKVEDLSDGSNVFVNIKCDGDYCNKPIINLKWFYYKRSTSKNNGKYYCQKCAVNIKNNNIRLSFKQWCYYKLTKELADWILSRWDYELNIDKDGNVIRPEDIDFNSRGLNGKGYWFNCLNYPEHKSEQKSIINSIRHDLSKNFIYCDQCNKIIITHPELVKYLTNKEDASKYSIAERKLPIKCLDCGYEKESAMYDLIRNGVCCPKCSDGGSYPEKFLFGFLEQLLNKDFIVQLNKTTLKWCGSYKYDNYIEKINCIIETHGIQHYEEVKSNWRSLTETQNSDFDKEWLARSNNIKNYIILDCRRSDIKWIRHSIMNSDLPQLLNFKEEDIDWLKCHEIGLKSLVKVSCDLWNNGLDIIKISVKLKKSSATIRRYLEQGKKLEWCDYNGQKEFMKNAKKIRRQIICLNTGEIFNYINEANKRYNTTSISQCCKGVYKSSGVHPHTGENLIWMYYDEFIIKNKILGWKDTYMKNIFDYYKVICLTTGEIFESLKEAGDKYNINRIYTILNYQDLKYTGIHPETGEKLRWMLYRVYKSQI